MRVQSHSFQAQFTRRYIEGVSEALPDEVKDRVDLRFQADDRSSSLSSLLQASRLLSHGVVSDMTPLGLAGAVALELVDRSKEQAWDTALEQQRSQLMPDSSDPQAQSRLDRVARTLRPHLSQETHFQAVESPESNGFATPGGRVFISEDLCKSAPIESLTWLVGHEIGHTEARDSVKAYGYSTLNKLLEEAGGDWLKYLAKTPFTSARKFRTQLNREYAEIQIKEEQAADTRGVELTKALGMDPQRVSTAIAGHFASSLDKKGLILPAAERIASLRKQVLEPG